MQNSDRNVLLSTADAAACGPTLNMPKQLKPTLMPPCDHTAKVSCLAVFSHRVGTSAKRVPCIFGGLDGCWHTIMVAAIFVLVALNESVDSIDALRCIIVRAAAA